MIQSCFYRVSMGDQGQVLGSCAGTHILAGLGEHCGFRKLPGFTPVRVGPQIHVLLLFGSDPERRWVTSPSLGRDPFTGLTNHWGCSMAVERSFNAALPSCMGCPVLSPKAEDSYRMPALCPGTCQPQPCGLSKPLPGAMSLLLCRGTHVACGVLSLSGC